MAIKARRENPLYRIVTLKSITDGYTYEHKDYGTSYKNSKASVEYGRILRALKERSKLDGGRIFKVVDVKDPNLKGKSLDDRLSDLGEKAPKFCIYEAHEMWTKEDDERLKKHLNYREEVSAAAQEQSIINAQQAQANDASANATAAAVAAVLQTLDIAKPKAPAAPAAPAAKAPKAPKKDAKDAE